MTRQIKEAVLCGLLGCTLLLTGAGCTRDKTTMPIVREGIPATVTMVDQGVDLMAANKDGEPCLALSVAGLVRGDRNHISEYACMDSRDPLVTSLLIVDGSLLAVGGAVAPSVATVTVNGQPAPRDGQYFLAVLPRIPDSGVTILASDRDGRLVSSQEHSKALITSPRFPSQTSPPRP